MISTSGFGSASSQVPGAGAVKDPPDDRSFLTAMMTRATRRTMAMKARITPVTTEALELTTPRTMASFSSDGAGRGRGLGGERKGKG